MQRVGFFLRLGYRLQLFGCRSEGLRVLRGLRLRLAPVSLLLLMLLLLHLGLHLGLVIDAVWLVVLVRHLNVVVLEAITGCNGLLIGLAAKLVLVLRLSGHCLLELVLDRFDVLLN